MPLAAPVTTAVRFASCIRRVTTVLLVPQRRLLIWTDEFQRSVVQATEAQAQDITEIVLMRFPGGVPPLARNSVEGALDIAGSQRHCRLYGQEPVWSPRGALNVAMFVHVVQQAADILRDQFALQGPRCIGVAECQRQVGHIAEHSAAIGQRFSEIDRNAINDDLCAAHRFQHKTGGCDNDVCIEFGAEASRMPVVVKRST